MLYQEGTVCLNRDVFSLFKLGAFFCSSISYCVKSTIDIFANRATSFDYPNVEDVFSINGRGSVATERVERGQIKKGNEVEIVGLRDVSKELDAAMAGEKAGILLRG